MRHFYSVFESHSFDHLGQVVEAANVSPAFLGARAELEYERQQGGAGQAAFGPATG